MGEEPGAQHERYPDEGSGPDRCVASNGPGYLTIEGRAASLAYNRRHEELIKVVAEGKIPKLEELITRKITFDDFVEKGIKALLEEKDSQSASEAFFF